MHRILKERVVQPGAGGPLAARFMLWLLVALSWSAARADTVIYSTRFEVSEGYNPQLDLAGQNGWIGSGGNGLLTNFFANSGQQAYIGFVPPAGNTNDFLSVYRPINLAPIPTNQMLINFSVRMQVVDSTSTNGPWDDFRWSVYNTEGHRLFSLDFDNSSLLISYVLDDDKGFVSTDVSFDTLGYYDLVLSMNFARNLWTATLNDEVIVNAKPITTMGSALNLGDIDAVWALRDRDNPGDNYLLFDDYTVTAQSGSSIPPKLETIGYTKTGVFQARLWGEPGLVYAIESSSDLSKWEPLTTVTALAGGVADFQDSSARNQPRRFYRARQGP